MWCASAGPLKQRLVNQTKGFGNIRSAPVRSGFLGFPERSGALRVFFPHGGILVFGCWTGHVGGVEP